MPDCSCRGIGGPISEGLFQRPTVKVFTSSGTYTTPSSVDYIEVYAIGGGGGGGGSKLPAPGAGGGSGCPAFSFYGPGTYSFTIGAGGAGGATGTTPTDGSAGGDTVFGTMIGGRGLGGDNGSTTLYCEGGLAGTATNAVFALGRETGRPPQNGIPGNVPGAGGSNYFGTGGRGVYYIIGGVIAGESGSGFGSGGAGGMGSVGGTGAPGAVIIIEHY